jgi:hypothetical protein
MLVQQHAQELSSKVWFFDQLAPSSAIQHTEGLEIPESPASHLGYLAKLREEDCREHSET